MNEENDSLSV